MRRTSAGCHRRPIQTLIAEAVERCITADDPPARIAVGADAEGYARFVRDTTDDDYAAFMRSFFGGLRGRLRVSTEGASCPRRPAGVSAALDATLTDASTEQALNSALV